MAIYGIYSGKDKKSYICDLQMADARAATLPTYRMLLGSALPQDGGWEDPHVSSFWGTMIVIMRGRIGFGVSGGKRRSVVGKAGDIFIFIDTQGDGHSTHAPAGGELFQAAQMRFADSADGLWEDFKKGFTGWPDNVLPPRTLADNMRDAPPRHRGPDRTFDMKLFEQSL